MEGNNETQASSMLARKFAVLACVVLACVASTVLFMQVTDKHGRTITADYLAEMSYADMTVRETLRLAMVVAALPRRAQDTFEIGGYTVPKVH